MLETIIVVSNYQTISLNYKPFNVEQEEKKVQMEERERERLKEMDDNRIKNEIETFKSVKADSISLSTKWSNDKYIQEQSKLISDARTVKDIVTIHKKMLRHLQEKGLEPPRYW